MKNETQFRIPEQVVSCDLNNESVMLNLNSGVYFGMNETATVVWNAVGQKKNFAEMVRMIEEEFEVDAAESRKDLEEFLNQLLKKELIQIQDEPRS